MTSFYYNYQNALRISFLLTNLFKFLFPLENSRTIATNYLTKESRQSIMVIVVSDAIMLMLLLELMSVSEILKLTSSL